MHEAGRIDTPPPDANRKSGGGVIDADGYDSLVSSLAAVTDGFSGAELAGLVRAAASYALERAVGGGAGASEAAGCRVTAEDFGRGLADVTRSKSSAGTAAGGRAANGTAVAATTAVEERQTAAVDDVSSDGSAAAAAEGPREDGEKAAASRQQKAPFTVTKPSVAAATVAAARAEGAVGGNLSAQVKGVVFEAIFLFVLVVFLVDFVVEQLTVFAYVLSRRKCSDSKRNIVHAM